MAYEPRNRYKVMNDRELLALTAAGDELAFEEFFDRHKTFLYAVCYRHYAASLALKLGIKGYVEDLLYITFEQAVLHARDFKDDGLTEYEDIKTQANKWLCGIAHNAYIDILRKHQGELTVHFETDRELENRHSCDSSEDITASPSSKASSLNSKIDAAREAVVNHIDKKDLKEFLGSPENASESSNQFVQHVLEIIERILSPEEQLLVYIVIERYPEDFPGWLTRDLAEILGIKEGSVRVKRGRAIRKIKEHF